ncbi:MAG: chromosome partitioning protein Soj [Candidatus Sericytochromatia bacterium]|nr:MAG: chromosome partitioning protein Soj [Candidatus Sericytochromatia bacterium]
MSKIITFISKNNCYGKTTTILNLSTWLSLLGKRTLIIDFDMKGSITKYFDNKYKCDIKEVLIEDKLLEQAVYDTYIKDLFILPCIKQDSELDSLIFDIVSENLFSLKNLIDNSEIKFDYIFIDTSNKDIFIKTALIASDISCFIIKAQDKDLNDILDMTRDLQEIKENYNRWIELGGILINFYTENIESRKLLTKFKEKIGDLLFKTIIPFSNTINESNKQLKPINFYDIKSFTCEIYMRLANEFMSKF